MKKPYWGIAYFIYRIFRKIYLVTRARSWPLVGKLAVKLNEAFFRAVRPEKIITYFGQTIYLDVNDSLKLSLYGIYEPVETKLAMEHIKPGDVVFDLGANIGYFTLIFSKAVGDKGKVFAFEPDPVSFALLKKNIEANGCNNCVLFQKAVSDKNGTLKLFMEKDNLADHRIYDSGDGRPSIEITTVTGDWVMGEYGVRPSFIKMDIQGSEPLAIKGMDKLLSSGLPLKMIVEFWPEGLKLAGANPLKLAQSLRDYGFEMYSVDDTKETLELITDISQERNIGDNIFCVRC